MAANALDEICGLPLAPPGWRLGEVTLEIGDRLKVRYEDDQGGGWVHALLLPRHSTDRMLKRLEHCSVYYEGELPQKSFEHRARAADLLADVASRAEARLAVAAREGGVRFPHGLAWRPDLPRTIELDPRGLRELLPELGSGELPGGFEMVDAYFDAAVLCLELGAEDAPERVVLRVSRASGHGRARTRTTHFEVEERWLGSVAHSQIRASADARAASSIVMLLLRLRDTEALGVSASREAERTAVPLAPPPPESSDLSESGMLASPEIAFRLEAELLQPAFAAHAEFFGQHPRVHRIEGAPVESYRVSFTAEGEPGVTLFPRARPGLRHRRTLREYVESLGFAVHDDGAIRTVPTPESLGRLLAAYGIRGSGFKPLLLGVDGWQEEPEVWLDLCTEGTIGINVGTPKFYRRHHTLLRLRTPRHSWARHLTAVGSDMSSRVLATHRVPHSSLIVLGARVGDTMRDCRRLERLDALSPLVEIYDSDLGRHCDEIWEALGRPEDFAEAFEDPDYRRRWDEIVDRRIDEAHALLRARPPIVGERARASIGLVADAAGDAVAGARRLWGGLRGRGASTRRR